MPCLPFHPAGQVFHEGHAYGVLDRIIALARGEVSQAEGSLDRGPVACVYCLLREVGELRDLRVQQAFPVAVVELRRELGKRS